MITAECHSDDFEVQVAFDATAWFEQASEEEIIALAGCDWRGDYPADVVAQHFQDNETSELFDYLADRPVMLNGDTVGFECSVAEEDALEWLAANRPNIAAKIEVEASTPTI